MPDSKDTYKNIAAIVVTYNRAELLKECLKALSSQTYPLKKVYIVDNASTDSTKDVISSFCQKLPIEILALNKNIGGAGGFHVGLKKAHGNNDLDGFWLMDDDGIPADDCLEELVKYMDKYPYICPLVLDVEDDTKLAFARNGSNNLETLLDENKNKDIIERMSAPFNGILLRKDLVDTIGYPKKEMFIWGDEVEYNLRASKYGFIPVTVLKAIHRHPMDRLIRKNSFFKKGIIIDVESNLRNYCKYRNTAYSLKKYKGFLKTTGLYAAYITYFLFQDRWNWGKCRFFHNAFMDGIKEDFSKHAKYLPK